MKEFSGQDLEELGKAIMLKIILPGKSLTEYRRKGVIMEFLVREEENSDSFSLRKEVLCKRTFQTRSGEITENG